MILDARVKNSAQRRRVRQFDTCITFCDDRPLSVTDKKLTIVSSAHGQKSTDVQFLKDWNNQRTRYGVLRKLRVFLR